MLFKTFYLLSLWIKSLSSTTQTMGQYSHVIFVELYKVILTLESVDKTVTKSNESYSAGFSCGAVCYDKTFVEGIPWCVK